MVYTPASISISWRDRAAPSGRGPPAGWTPSWGCPYRSCCQHCTCWNFLPVNLTLKVNPVQNYVHIQYLHLHVRILDICMHLWVTVSKVIFVWMHSYLRPYISQLSLLPLVSHTLYTQTVYKSLNALCPLAYLCFLCCHSLRISPLCDPCWHFESAFQCALSQVWVQDSSFFSLEN